MDILIFGLKNVLNIIWRSIYIVFTFTSVSKQKSVGLPNLKLLLLTSEKMTDVIRKHAKNLRLKIYKTIFGFNIIIL